MLEEKKCEKVHFLSPTTKNEHHSARINAFYVMYSLFYAAELSEPLFIPSAEVSLCILRQARRRNQFGDEVLLGAFGLGVPPMTD